MNIIILLHIKKQNYITNKITKYLDNMTDEQIEQLAQRVARIILDQLHEGLILDMQPNVEEELLAELAKCMTLMSKYLAEEQYEKCEFLKMKIKIIEQKFKNL